ncbi:2-C-methyl-D-erythritol 4-phosphate cytidylyltransferase [Actinoplanes lutulentus]|uniref:2-C-methyl-D-erythritol 4-phosphate cytidylyltransferase n=1 Tax=Actinoplanes lutulentus TaxID=1287878 RepID=UPI000DBAB20C|nr:2-C-methyl-D-erythritol 4-phosphate cytidylyltransferase [Actinoplanes lutulentus]MBB2945742.1 2-C-methyl-D-erythritol 4-phosphate cytidylyltransferase [Actinoplanes lutulentus]
MTAQPSARGDVAVVVSGGAAVVPRVGDDVAVVVPRVDGDAAAVVSRADGDAAVVVSRAGGDVAVVVPAAGAGLRLGPGAPKALRLLDGEPLLVHAIRRIAASPSVAMIVVAAPPAEVDAVGALLAPIAPVVVVAGGAERQESVAAALAVVPSSLGIVLVHDAARCLAPVSLFERVAEAVRSGADAVIPAQPVVDTIKEVSADGVVLGTVDRSVLRAVQTPQGFRASVLRAAHAAAAGLHTDDAGAVEKLGLPVLCVPGSDLALKITRPMDLALAAHLLTVPDPGI